MTPDAAITTAVVARLRAAGCVFAEEEADLLVEAAASPDALADLVARRVAGEPLEPLLGWVAFSGMRIPLDPGVFVPRRRTEFLAESAASATGPDGTALDLCCGAGAIAAVILAAHPSSRVLATDLDPVAVRSARRILGADRVVLGDLFAGLPEALRHAFDVIAVNAPYVPHDDIALMPPEARLYEPHVALDGGRDGLDLHRRIAAEAADWLRPAGVLLIEAGAAQAPASAAAFAAAGFASVTIERDESRDATVVRAAVAASGTTAV